MARDELLYLRHILDAINTVEEYLQGVSEKKFNDTRLIQDGVIRQIEIIGEAVRHVSKDVRKTYPEIPGRMWQGCATNSSINISGWTSKRFGIRQKKIYQY